jgi:hypothetical protein
MRSGGRRPQSTGLCRDTGTGGPSRIIGGHVRIIIDFPARGAIIGCIHRMDTPGSGDGVRLWRQRRKGDSLRIAETADPGDVGRYRSCQLIGGAP